MLQWMGGSRRKVTASRKSTQKRQKQYFEQRKQQQHHPQTGADSLFDGTKPCAQQDNNRSLDILSLLNLSAVVQNYKSSFYSGKDSENTDVAKGQPMFLTANLTAVDPSEFKEHGPTSGCQLEIVHPKKFFSGDLVIRNRDASVNDERTGKVNLSSEHSHPLGFQTETKYRKIVPEGQAIGSIKGGDRTDKFKTASEQKLCVFDLLGDDGPIGNLEENSSCEAHVAFAMEGLGEMGTETPVHSPEQPARMFSYGSTSHVMAPKQFHSSKNLNSLLYDLELEKAAMSEETDLPLYGSFLEPIICGSSKREPYKGTRDLATDSKFWNFNIENTKLKSTFADEEMFWEIDTDIDGLCNAAPNILIHNPPYQHCTSFRIDSSDDCWNLGDHEISDFTSRSPYTHKVSIAEKTRSRFNISESTAPYCERRRAERKRDLRTPDGIWSPSVGKHYDIGYAANQPLWPSYISEDAEDRLSLLREESCSSSAEKARRNATERQSSSSMNKERHVNDIRNPVNKGSRHAYRHSGKWNDFCENTPEPGDFTKLRNVAHVPNHISGKRFKPDNIVLFEESFVSADKDSEFSSICRSSQAKEHASSYPNPWSEDPLRAHSFPIKMSENRLEKHTFCQPSNHMHFDGTPILTTLDSGLNISNSCTNTKIDMPGDSFPFAAPWRDAGFLHVCKEVAAGEDKADESVHEVANIGKFEVQKDACIGSNDLSSEDGRASEASGTKENCGTSKRLQEPSPERENQKVRDSAPDLEERTSSLKILDKFVEDQIDIQTSILHHNKNAGLQHCCPKGGEVEGGNIAPNPSYQIVGEVSA